MELDQIIDRIGDEDNPPTVEELAAAKTELETAKETLRASIKDEKSLAQIRSMKDDYDKVDDALSKVSGALTEAEAELDRIKAEVGPEDPEDPENGDPEKPESDDPEEQPVEDKTPVAASIRQTVARVRESAPAPIVVSDRDDLDRLTAVEASYTLRGKEMETISPSDLGRELERTHSQFGGSKTTVLNIKHELHPDRTLTGDPSANERKMLDLFGAEPFVPITAAGGCCSIPQPIYDQPMIGSLARPIRDAFDTLGASRGAVQAYPPICLPDEGADVWTCAQDEAVTDDPETWKSCANLDCSDEEPTVVEPIFKCITTGTFQEKFAPEQWEAFSFQVDKLAARLAEARLFNWLAAASTSVYGAPLTTGSTYANFIKQQIRIAAAMRQDQRAGDTQIITVGSNLIYDAIAEDTLTRRLNDADEVEFLKSRVNAVLREFGITYVGSDDVAAMDPFTYDGSLPGYPDELPMVSLPAGSAKFLDGGEKNIGLTADFGLARQNKVAIFDEFWEGLLVRNCNVVFSTVAVEDCDLLCPSDLVPVEA